MAAASPRRLSFADETPKQSEKANGLGSFGCRLGDPFRNCLEDSLEPLRLDAAENTPPEEEISDRSDRFGCLGIVDYLLQNVVARRQSTAHNLEDTRVVQFLEHFVGGQDCFCVFFRCLIEPQMQFSAAKFPEGSVGPLSSPRDYLLVCNCTRPFPGAA